MSRRERRGSPRSDRSPRGRSVRSRRGDRRDRSRSSSGDRDARRERRRREREQGREQSSRRRGRDASRSPSRRSRRRRRSRSKSESSDSGKKRGSRDGRRSRRRRHRSMSGSRSPARRSSKNDKKDRRRRRSRDGSRSPRDRRRRRSRRDRDRSSSPRRRSRSPARRRRRRDRDRDYSDDNSSSDYEDDRRRRRRRRGRRHRKRERVFRLGDKVTIRMKGGAGGEYTENGEIDEINTDGMYGERCYRVYIESQNRWERWVSWKDLEYRHVSREEARITNELYKAKKLMPEELREQLRAGKRIASRENASRRPHSWEDARDERRGQPGRRDRGGAQSERGGGRTRGYQSEPDNAPYQHAAEGGRAASVPLQNYTWPQFIADLTHAVYNRDKDGAPADDLGYDDDGRRENNQPVQTVQAPHDVRSHFGDKLERKEEVDHYDDGGYDDEDLNARQEVESVKNGAYNDDVNVGRRQEFANRGDDWNLKATRGGRSGGQPLIQASRSREFAGHPLIHIHVNQEPPSNRNHYRDNDYADNRGGRTRGGD